MMFRDFITKVLDFLPVLVSSLILILDIEKNIGTIIKKNLILLTEKINDIS